MKNLFLLALALIMSCTLAFAQSNTPYAKGKYYGKKMIEYAFANNTNGMNSLTASCENYVTNNLETEDDLVKFLEGLEAGMREGCKACGLSDEETDMVIEMAGEALLQGMMQELGY
jgi:predicted hydrocarbon binding protein